jgi:hypothetical protein
LKAVADLAAPAPQALAAPGVLHDRILHVTLFITVLASSVAFIEPSPHDLLMGALAVACLIAGVRIDHKLVPLIMLLMVWNLGLASALLNVLGDGKAFVYAGISFYLSIAAILFACLFSDDSLRRLNTMMTAYILSALSATAFGVIGYFNLFPGAEQLFASIGRANATFKDPNVFGPFLILPILFLLEHMVTRGLRLREFVTIFVLLVGLFLSFSRGAWIHFALSAALLLTLLFLTSRSTRARARVLFFSMAAMASVAVLAVALVSIDAVNELFVQRAQVIQYYDVGPGGRFQLQKLALQALLDYPNGMGPYAFEKLHGLQQHNVYLQAFLVYGWLGGVTYAVLILLTLAVGLRAVFAPTPWQPYLICAVAAFFGEAVEGLVVDTDHWRHFFLLLGMIWGLAVANMNARRRAANGLPV